MDRQTDKQVNRWTDKESNRPRDRDRENKKFEEEKKRINQIGRISIPHSFTARVDD